MPTHTNTKRKNILFAKDPHCFWCGVLTINPEHHKPYKNPPANFATVDHVYNKLDWRRQKGIPGPTVLACYKCNQRRSREDQRKQLDPFFERAITREKPREKPREYITQNSLERKRKEREMEL